MSFTQTHATQVVIGEPEVVEDGVENSDAWLALKDPAPTSTRS